MATPDLPAPSSFTSATFAISPALPTDLPTIAAECLESFGSASPYGLLLWGRPYNPTHVASSFHTSATTDPTLRWLKATPSTSFSSTTLAAAMSFHIYAAYVPSHRHMGGPCSPSTPWHGDAAVRAEAEQGLKVLWHNINSRSTEAHVRLALLFTVEGWQRRGAATVLLERVCGVADLLELPVWVEASGRGRALYAKWGFEEVCGSTWEGGEWFEGVELTIMRRAVGGGKRGGKGEVAR